MTREELTKALAVEGLSHHSWSNHANYVYQERSYDYDKVLYCVQGKVTFHLRDGDVVLYPGRLLDILADTQHAARMGPDDMECPIQPG